MLLLYFNSSITYHQRNIIYQSLITLYLIKTLMKYYLSIGVSIKSATINYTLNKSKTVWRINNSSFLKFFFYAILFWTVTLTWHQPFLFSGHHERFWNFLCFLEDQGQMLANMPSKLTIGEFFFLYWVNIFRVG